MSRLHKLTFFSFIALAGFFLIFLLFAENNYTGFDSYTEYNIRSIALNIVFAALLIANLVLSFLSLINLIVESFKNKKANVKMISLGVYPIVLICILSGFKITNFLNYLSSPFQIIFNLLA